MANCVGWFGVRGATAADVARELRATFPSAKRDDIPEYFMVFEPPPGAGASTGWTVVILTGSGSQYAVPGYSAPSWAQALSLRMGAPAVAFFILEGGWSYWVFDSGNEVVAQEDYSLPLPEVHGDVARGAALLGVDESIFGRYEQACRDGREEPFPGDEYPPSFEWGHLDFARRLGPVYPGESDPGQRVTPSQEEISSAPAEWQGLPQRLPLPQAPPHPQATGKEIDLENFPSGDDPF